MDVPTFQDSQIALFIIQKNLKKGNKIFAQVSGEVDRNSQRDCRNADNTNPHGYWEVRGDSHSSFLLSNGAKPCGMRVYRQFSFFRLKRESPLWNKAQSHTWQGISAI